MNGVCYPSEKLSLGIFDWELLKNRFNLVDCNSLLGNSFGDDSCDKRLDAIIKECSVYVHPKMQSANRINLFRTEKSGVKSVDKYNRFS